MEASNFHFYSKMFTELNSALTTYVNDTAINVIEAITPVSRILFMTYVCLWGWAMMRGVISEPIMDGVGRIVRLALISGIALQIGNYNGFLADFLWNSPDALANYIGGSNSTSNTSYLDSLMSKMYDFGEVYNLKAQANRAYGIPDFSFLIIAFIIWTAGLLTTAYGAFLLVLSKMGLSIALGVGPIFVLLTLFEPTKRFFDAWLGQTLNYVFMVVLSAASIRLIMSILDYYLKDINLAKISDPMLDHALPAIVFSAIAALVLKQMPAMASALGGGVALGTLGAVGWAYSKTTSGLSAMRPTNVRRSANRVRSDVRIATGAAKTVASAPMTVYRRITSGTKNRVSKG